MNEFLKQQVLGEECIMRMVALTNKLVKDAGREVKTVFDIGAAEGTYSQFFAQQFPRADILAFEPYPPSFEKLAIKALGTKIIASHFGFSNEIGFKKLYLYPDSPDSNSFIFDGNVEKSVEVPTDTLDNFYHSNNRIDFMKIDAEGSEPQILEGGMETLKRTDNLFIEIAYIRRGLKYAAGIFSTLADLGFTLVYCSEDGNFFFTRLWDTRK